MPKTVGFLAGLMTCTASAVWACGFHSYTPQPTLVDRLLQSDHIVLARSDPENPFRYKPTTAIEGAAELADLPFLVDSVSRRRLAADPDAEVLFARDGAYGPWVRLAFVDPDMRLLLDNMVRRLPAWEQGDTLDRFATFAAYLDHPDRRLRHLALRELDLADYGFLASHNLGFDTKRMLSNLNNPAQADLKAIRILLLGLSGEEIVRARLQDGLERAVRFDDPLLGAYATALIELDGADKVAQLTDRYLVAPEVSLAAKEMIVEAFALHSQFGSAEMIHAVQESVDGSLKRAPSLAPSVARQFGARGVWSQSASLSNLLKSRALTSPLDVLAVSQYIALANDPGANSASGSGVLK